MYKGVLRGTDLHQILSPYEPQKECLVRGHKVPSWGTQPFGYDVRLDPNEFLVFTNIFGGTTDPRNFDERSVTQVVQPKLDDDMLSYLIIPPNGTALGVTIETFTMPDDVLGMVFGKSTYSRCGLVINCTIIEPGWRGRLVMELHNASPVPIKVYADGGIAQIIFIRGEEPLCPYDGKYQDQGGLVRPHV